MVAAADTWDKTKIQNWLRQHEQIRPPNSLITAKGQALADRVSAAIEATVKAAMAENGTKERGSK